MELEQNNQSLSLEKTEVQDSILKYAKWAQLSANGKDGYFHSYEKLKAFFLELFDLISEEEKQVELVDEKEEIEKPRKISFEKGIMLLFIKRKEKIDLFKRLFKKISDSIQNELKKRYKELISDKEVELNKKEQKITELENEKDHQLKNKAASLDTEIQNLKKELKLVESEKDEHAKQLKGLKDTLVETKAQLDAKSAEAESIKKRPEGFLPSSGKQVIFLVLVAVGFGGISLVAGVVLHWFLSKESEDIQQVSVRIA